MVLKKIIGKIHLFLGLTTGLVVFIVAVTGAIYCFAPELQNITQAYRTVQEQEKRFLPPSKISFIAEQQLPGRLPQRIYYGNRNQAVHILFSNKKDFNYSVFINPYTGQVLEVRNNGEDFFSIILNLHRTLLNPYGHEIIRWCTLVFLIMLITGIILWWPKNKAAKKQGLIVKWNHSPKRLNYDLHRVFGFYATWIIIFTVLTGLIWSFDGFAKAVYTITGANHSIVIKKAPLSDTTTRATSGIAPIDLIWQKIEPDMQQKYATALFILPGNKNEAILLRANPENGTLYKTDFRYYDQYTAKEIPGAFVWGNYADGHTVADKIKRMNYDIHTGAILGWPGRVAIFFATLIAASLPITGFYIWWGRNKKAKSGSKQNRKTTLKENFENKKKEN